MARATRDSPPPCASQIGGVGGWVRVCGKDSGQRAPLPCYGVLKAIPLEPPSLACPPPEGERRGRNGGGGHPLGGPERALQGPRSSWSGFHQPWPMLLARMRNQRSLAILSDIRVLPSNINDMAWFKPVRSGSSASYNKSGCGGLQWTIQPGNAADSECVNVRCLTRRC